MQRCIIVLGPHRSGTSAMAGLLNLMGIDFGPFLMPPKKGENEKGFWEHSEIVQIHERLLRALDSNWHDISPLPEHWWQSNVAVESMKDILKVLKRDFLRSPIWGIKDPRMCRLLPLWLKIFDELDLDPLFVLISRHPYEVAMSLKKRNGLQRTRSYLLWLDHMLKMEFYTHSFPRTFISYDGLLSNWRKAVSEIASAIDIRWPASFDEVKHEAEFFLSPSLRHEKADHDSKSFDPQISSWVFDLYNLVVNAKDEGQLKKGFSRIRNGFNEAVSLFGPTLRSEGLIWREEIKHVAGDYQKEIERIGKERDRMLEDKNCQIHRFSQIAPLVSVIVVNFNGKPYLGPFLESLMRQTYQKYEIIVVDNGSADGSASFIRNNFPHVRLICSEKNLGFAGGNNLGMRVARGRLYALINNDTVVEPDWLYYLVSEMESDSKIGAVGSKIIFFKPYLNFTIDLPTFCPAKMGGLSDRRNLGFLMDENSGIDGCSYHKPVFCAGFYNPEYINEMVVRWTMGHAEFMFPVDRTDSDAALRLVVAGGKENSGSRFSVKLDGELLGERTLGKDFAEFLFNIPVKKVREKSFYLLNNAASFLDEKGNAGDRGIYRPDRGQFDEREDVEALCGCSMLIRKEVLQKIGYFDEDFFMYYEDTDLSWRMRRHGFRLRYQPLSVVNHIHAGTSREGSSVFIFYVTRNRILMTLKNASLKDNVIIFLVECGQNLRLAYRWLRAIKDGPIAAQIGKELKIRLRVYLSLFKLAPRMILKRLRLISN